VRADEIVVVLLRVRVLVPLYSNTFLQLELSPTLVGLQDTSDTSICLDPFLERRNIRKADVDRSHDPGQVRPIVQCIAATDDSEKNIFDGSACHQTPSSATF
jgi:hypothetical protein